MKDGDLMHRMKEMGLSGKVMPENEFDTKVLGGLIPTGEVRACTTMTLDRFRSDLNGMNVDREHWITCTREEPAKRRGFLSLFRRGAEEDDGSREKIVEQIQHNRDYFRWQMGLRCALSDLFTNAREAIYSGKYSNILYTNREYNPEQPVKSFDDLVDLVVQAHTYPNYQIGTEAATQAANLFINSLDGSYDNLNIALFEARNRQGVQVVYGAESFDNTPFRYTGDMSSSKQLPSRIHPRHITAILPLGDHEREYLK